MKTKFVSFLMATVSKIWQCRGVNISINSNYMKDKINNWLLMLASDTNIPSDIVALNFGLFESADDYYVVYLTGSKVYDPDDDDWACDIDWEPKEKYLMLPEAKCDIMGWEEFQNKVATILIEAFGKDASLSRWLGKRTVTTGFDDGQLERLI